jgi:putative membrane protein
LSGWTHDVTLPTDHRDRLAGAVVVALTVLILTAVIALRFVPRPEQIPGWATSLPALNASLNSVATLLLLSAYAAIRTGRPHLHKRLNLAAFALSCAFLISYVLFHAVAPETRFPAGNALRPVYLFVLITHIILAMVVLPLVLTTFWLALRGKLAAHRRLARWTLPIWLYVTVTGVAVYFMIAPHYPFR